MRKFQKQQILEVVQSLHTLHGKMKDILNGQNYETVQTVLADCQEAAIRIGETIEQTEGNGTQAVSCLEQYCETLYQVSARMREISGQKAYKSLESSLIKAQNAILHMEERREVVFLPYKASMWDSLESVWKAADEDPDCDAYVIPIPYYDKNPDGSFKEMHYEGDQYPKYVPVTNYEDYDFDGRRPDAIFIHNPYDEFNFVTSVHPFFYAKNLKQFTQMLVYIPYFVLREILPSDEEAVKGIEHFCMVPGTFYADKVFVQSENMRTIYIKVLTDAFGTESRRTWESKILGLGSPKNDKVMNTRKEELEIPREWIDIIQKPDGSWKKVVFYNTSVSALLQYSEKMLEKMQDVFRVFKVRKEEAALLWRPHPLIKATIESMRPQLWQQYEKLVEEYREEGWGIYDDSADLNRAVALCDAYYGDGSSVVQLCTAVGVPILYQNCEVIYDKAGKDDYLWSYNFVIDGNNVWFVPEYYNVLCRYDMQEDRLKKIKEIQVDGQLRNLYCNVVKIGNYVVLLPFSANKIYVYDTVNENEMIMIDIRDYGQEKFLFVTYAVWGHYIYLFPRNYPAICRLDTDSWRLEYFDDWYRSCGFDEDRLFFHWQCYAEGSSAYLPMVEQNGLLRFDMEDASFEFMQVGGTEEHFSTISCVNGQLYLSNQNGDIVICELNGREIRRIANTISKRRELTVANAGYFYINSIVVEEDIYYFPGSADCVVRFHTPTETMHRYTENQLMTGEGKGSTGQFGFMFSNIRKCDGDVYGFHIPEQYFFRWNVRTGQEKRFRIAMESLPPEKLRELYSLYAQKYNALEAIAQYLRLDRFVDCIIEGRKTVETGGVSQVGYRIYKNIW